MLDNISSRTNPDVYPAEVAIYTQRQPETPEMAIDPRVASWWTVTHQQMSCNPAQSTLLGLSQPLAEVLLVLFIAWVGWDREREREVVPPGISQTGGKRTSGPGPG